MKVGLIGHESVNAMQEIIHAMTGCEEIRFCPPKEAEEAEDAVISVYEGEGRVTTTIINGGVRHTERSVFGDYSRNTAQNAVKAAYYRLAARVYGKTLPWGSLTGIRPALLAQRAAAKGRDPVAALMEDYFVSEEKARLASAAAQVGGTLAKSASPRGVSLYLSVPFCPSRCLYCSFISTPLARFETYIKPYVEHLLAELDATGAMLQRLGLVVDTVYIGGGTPTILDADSLKRLLSRLGSALDMGGVKELTVEAGRPDTVTRDKLCVLKEHGVSRISINPQTLSDEVLVRIGRRHTSAQFLEAFALARSCGFDNINTDVIAGLPLESEAMFARSLEGLLSLRPESVTVHAMSVKRASRLKGELQGRSGESGGAAGMVKGAHDALFAQGYAPYYLYRQKDTVDNLENTGYSLRGRECLYNVLMMDDVQSIVALGAGGVTKIIGPDGRIERVFNLKDPFDYLARFDEILARKARTESLLRRGSAGGMADRKE